MAVTPLCDRAQQSRVAIQKGFIDHVCAPFFDALATLYPALRPAVHLNPSHTQPPTPYTSPLTPNP